jgi:pSer/pThr/pTyr-binding forkhead associated (FHA) protein
MPELIVKLKKRELQRFPIVGVKTLIGRDPSNDLVIDNMGVSRNHVSVEMQGGEFYIQDQSSANGVFVNGTPTRRQKLYNGDVMQVGKFAIVYSSLGGMPVDKLQRNAMLGDPTARGASPVNPEMTTALCPTDIGKFINSAGFHAQVEQTQAPQRRSRPNLPRVRAPAPVAPQRPSLGGPNAGNMNLPLPTSQLPQAQAQPGPNRYPQQQNYGPPNNGTMFGSAQQNAYLERQAATFRTLTIVLGVAVVSLMGLTVALIVFA